MKTIMFNSEKGGTGKTTLATLSAAYLAVRGHRVIMFDFDPQAHATISLNLPKEPGMFEVLGRGKPITKWLRQPDPDFVAPPNGMNGELVILPGDEDTHAIPMRAKDEFVLVEMLEDIEDAFDIAIIDTAPSAGMLLTLSWKAADYVLIPSQLEFLSMDGVAGTIERAQKSDVELLGIVPNMYQDTALHEGYLHDLIEAGAQYGWPIWDRIKLRVEWKEASALRRQMWSINAQMSKARHEAIKFCKRLETALIEVPHV